LRRHDNIVKPSPSDRVRAREQVIKPECLNPSTIVAITQTARRYGIMLVLTLVLFALPGIIVHDMSRFLPANISSTIFASTTPSQLQGTPLISPLIGLLHIALYAVVLLVVGDWLMTRSDTLRNRRIPRVRPQQTPAVS
jgi:hypothetical protein